MKSLKALHYHLGELELINCDAFDAYVLEGKLEPSNALYTCGLDQSQILYRINYIAVFSFEGWHGGEGRDAYFLFACVLQWLTNNDYDYDNQGFPEIDVEFRDDELADLEIRIRFEDKVYGLPDVPGQLPVVIAQPVPDVVQEFDIAAG